MRNKNIGYISVLLFSFCMPSFAVDIIIDKYDQIKCGRLVFEFVSAFNNHDIALIDSSLALPKWDSSLVRSSNAQNIEQLFFANAQLTLSTDSLIMKKNPDGVISAYPYDLSMHLGRDRKTLEEFRIINTPSGFRIRSIRPYYEALNIYFNNPQNRLRQKAISPDIIESIQSFLSEWAASWSRLADHPEDVEAHIRRFYIDSPDLLVRRGKKFYDPETHKPIYEFQEYIGSPGILGMIERLKSIVMKQDSIVVRFSIGFESETNTPLLSIQDHLAIVEIAQTYRAFSERTIAYGDTGRKVLHLQLDDQWKPKGIIFEDWIPFEK